jgi:hypothetical protein
VYVSILFFIYIFLFLFLKVFDVFEKAGKVKGYFAVMRLRGVGEI